MPGEQNPRFHTHITIPHNEAPPAACLPCRRSHSRRAGSAGCLVLETIFRPHGAATRRKRAGLGMEPSGCGGVGGFCRTNSIRHGGCQGPLAGGSRSAHRIRGKPRHDTHHQRPTTRFQKRAGRGGMARIRPVEHGMGAEEIPGQGETIPGSGSLADPHDHREANGFRRSTGSPGRRMGGARLAVMAGLLRHGLLFRGEPAQGARKCPSASSKPHGEVP
jgi:hypothetical protein